MCQTFQSYRLIQQKQIGKKTEKRKIQNSDEFYDIVDVRTTSFVSMEGHTGARCLDYSFFLKHHPPLQTLFYLFSCSVAATPFRFISFVACLLLVFFRSSLCMSSKQHYEPLHVFNIYKFLMGANILQEIEKERIYSQSSMH